ncbi:hypothetical protein BKE38_15280 [Pseudoroseomonas deserti]|uniref:Uncharacterized protein n=1 Tax=Teichococcus deserti TaxID=1817963 RepID=A0A1V2H0Q1_9PROT|nr:hypothetical protein [Pseudoroseomonas deserti]ONG51894.1 hypothetical protein BKE38_15280 [Pseudoroseomonas deserti]
MPSHSLRSWKIWLLAAVAVLASGWMEYNLIHVILVLTGRFPLFEGAAQAVLATLLLAALSAVTVEGWKFAALAGPLKRDWSAWAPFGLAFGTFQAIGVVVTWTLQRLTVGEMMGGFSPLLLVVAAKVGLIHAALGWLAAAAARPPGGPRLAFGAVVLATVLFALLPLRLASYLVPLPELLFQAEFWLQLAMVAGFAALAWRAFAATPVEPGPARRILATLLGVAGLTALGLGLAVLLVRNDPAPVLLVAAGLAFLVWMIHQQRRRGGMRRVG